MHASNFSKFYLLGFRINFTSNGLFFSPLIKMFIKLHLNMTWPVDKGSPKVSSFGIIFLSLKLGFSNQKLLALPSLF